MKPRYDNPLTPSQLEQLDDKDIDFSDIPEADEEFWKNAVVKFKGKIVTRQVTANFDYDVVDWFKSQGPGYQARMNAVLRSYYEAHKKD